MSWRHPPSSTAAVSATSRPWTLRLNVDHLAWNTALEESPRDRGIELRIVRLDAEEGPGARGQRGPGGVEPRWVRHRQLVTRQHAEHGGERGEQHRHLERDRDERRQTVEGAAADVERVRRYRHPVLEPEPRQPAYDPADQHEERHPRVVEVERLVQLLDREGRIGVELAVPLLVGTPARRHERVRVVELGHQAVEHTYSFTFA